MLDHGFYCVLRDDFRKDFNNLWMAITSFDHDGLKSVASKMGMGQYFRYLPLLFTGRTINSKKPLGAGITKEEIEFIKGNDEVNFDKISFLFQRLPSEVVFIFKAMHLNAMHHMRAGGDRRDRYMHYSRSCFDAAYEKSSFLGRMLRFWIWRMKLFIFEYSFRMYKALFGYKEYLMPTGPTEDEES